MNSHKPTMCNLADKKQFEKMRERARDAKWICKECGRVASAKNRICNPIDLYPTVE